MAIGLGRPSITNPIPDTRLSHSVQVSAQVPIGLGFNCHPYVCDNVDGVGFREGEKRCGGGWCGGIDVGQWVWGFGGRGAKIEREGGNWSMLVVRQQRDSAVYHSTQKCCRRSSIRCLKWDLHIVRHNRKTKGMSYYAQKGVGPLLAN